MSLYKIRDIWTVFRQTELRDSLVLLLMRKTFIAYAVAAFLVTLLHLYMEFNHHKKLVYRNLTRAEVVMAPVMSEALWHLNNDLILAETHIAIFLPDIAGVSILDTKGHIILQEGLIPTSEEDRPMSKEWIIHDLHDAVPFSYSSQLITHAFDLQDENSGTPTGGVQVYAANGAIWERMSNGFWLILLNAAFKTLVLWGCFICGALCKATAAVGHRRSESHQAGPTCQGTIAADTSLRRATSSWFHFEQYSGPATCFFHGAQQCDRRPEAGLSRLAASLCNASADAGPTDPICKDGNYWRAARNDRTPVAATPGDDWQPNLQSSDSGGTKERRARVFIKGA